MRRLDSIPDSVGVNLSKLQGLVEDGGAWRATVRGVAKKRAWSPRRPTLHCLRLHSKWLLYIFTLGI